MSGPGVAVVLFTGSECEAYSGMICPMHIVYEPGMTAERAREIAERAPGWTTPHIIQVSAPGDYLGPEYLHLET